MYFDHYGKEGSPVLVLLHGAAALDTFAGHYAALSEHFHVLVPHLPGAGQAAEEAYDPQAVCDALVSSGILAIWNFAPMHLNTPEGILVQNENMAASLAVLSKHLSERLGSKLVD